MADDGKSPSIYGKMAEMSPSGSAPPAPSGSDAPSGSPDNGGGQEEDDASIVAKLLQVIQKWQATTKNPKIVGAAVQQIGQTLNDVNTQLQQGGDAAGVGAGGPAGMPAPMGGAPGAPPDAGAGGGAPPVPA